MYKLQHNVFISHCYGAVHTLRLLDLISKEGAIDGIAAVVLFDLGVNAPASLGLVGKLPAFVLGKWYIIQSRGIGRWFDKGGLYRSISKGSMISVYKIQPSYIIIITIRKHRGGGTSPRSPHGSYAYAVI
jgi:hypothetical protein